MGNVSKLLERVIVECECDDRIDSGTFDIYNADHLVVLTEHIIKYGISESIVEDLVESIMDEGKYPERQAYNKDGWLVTFPSKEYRDAALKKRTHFPSDPTHGKGGMNLYYKRRGKQKREKSQAQSVVEPKASDPTAQPAAPTAVQAPVSKLPGEETEPSSIKATQQSPTASGTVTKRTGSDQPISKEPTTTPSGDVSKPTTSDTAPEAPAIDVPVITQPPAEYASISKKFAIQKGWSPEPYGEYRDAQGNSVAVVGLSGEVVPIKNNDREEYKIFAEKKLAQS